MLATWPRAETVLAQHVADILNVHPPRSYQVQYRITMNAVRACMSVEENLSDVGG